MCSALNSLCYQFVLILCMWVYAYLFKPCARYQFGREGAYTKLQPHVVLTVHILCPAISYLLFIFFCRLRAQGRIPPDRKNPVNYEQISRFLLEEVISLGGILCRFIIYYSNVRDESERTRIRKRKEPKIVILNSSNI
jgi:hypothetical protein